MTREAGADTKRGEDHTPAIFLVTSLLVFGANKVTSPIPGIDGSWITGINVASTAGMHFGRDIIFTYGPLAFLDIAQSLNRLQIMLAMAFALTATASLWFVVYSGIARTERRINAALIATVVVGVVSGSGPVLPSLLILLSASIMALRFMKDTGSRHTRWTPPAASAVAAILLQVKFSEGVALIAIAGLCSLFSPSQALRRAIESGLAFCATFTITWALTGQSFGDIPSWVTGSWDVAIGYSDAMSIEIKPNLLSYLMAIFLAITVVTLTLRWTAASTRRARLGILLAVLCLLGYSFKQGFTRHDEHDQMFFAVTTVLLIILLASAKRPRAVMGLLAASLVFTSASLERFNPIVARDAWKTNFQLLVDPDYQQFSLHEAALAAKSYYSLPPAIVSSTKGHPVTVDPWETTLAWAYDFDWHPVPIFQTYAAYTARLDQINADAIASAPHDQVVIRGLPVPVDNRNPMWDTPRYLLALACNYVMGPSDERWMTLRKSDQRCSALSEVSTIRLETGHQITLPDVQAGQILVGHFTPDTASPLSMIGHALGKDYSPLLVHADGVEYRLSTGLAAGPLLLHVPASLGWPYSYGGSLHYKVLAFSQPGTLKFETVTVER